MKIRGETSASDLSVSVARDLSGHDTQSPFCRATASRAALRNGCASSLGVNARIGQETPHRPREAMAARDCCIDKLLQNRGDQCAAGNFH
jgi:hypothetical protein